MKAKKYGCAYSFDLSAATDRLPASLTAAILERVTGVKGFGDAWLAVMVDRDFSVPLRRVGKGLQSPVGD